jgi:hypothetical protein
MPVSGKGSKAEGPSMRADGGGIDAKLLLAKRRSPMKKSALLIEEHFSS